MKMEAIQGYQPQTAEEGLTKEAILKLVQTESDLFSRSNPDYHFTTSTLIISEDYQEVLLIHHKLFNAWTWTGGHNDGNEDFKAVALKEAQEETGIQAFKWFSHDIQSLDIFPVAEHVRQGKEVAAHQHLNVAYILIADKKDPLIQNQEETNDIRWWPLEDLLKISQEPHMLLVYEKLLARLP